MRSVDHNLMFVMHRAKVENCSFARGSSSHFVAAAAAPADGIPHIYSVGHSESARDGCRAVQDASEWRTVHDRALQCATAGGARCKKMVPTPRYTLNTLRTRTPTPPPADSRVRATRLQLWGRSATLATPRRPAAARCADPHAAALGPSAQALLAASSTRYLSGRKRALAGVDVRPAKLPVAATAAARRCCSLSC